MLSHRGKVWATLWKHVNKWLVQVFFRTLLNEPTWSQYCKEKRNQRLFCRMVVWWNSRKHFFQNFYSLQNEVNKRKRVRLRSHGVTSTRQNWKRSLWTKIMQQVMNQQHNHKIWLMAKIKRVQTEKNSGLFYINNLYFQHLQHNTKPVSTIVSKSFDADSLVQVFSRILQNEPT